MRKIDFRTQQALFDTAASRRIEQTLQATLPAHCLMQRAGLSLAQLALAVAPHAQRVWLACGPGNNGGDGMEAALHLQSWGKQAIVTWLGQADSAPPDAAASYKRAIAAGVHFAQDVPEDFDLCIDALLGLGSSRAPEGRMAQWIAAINASAQAVLAVDLPTGLNADSGAAHAICVKATHTLSLLTLKPGLFTAEGRDAAGTVWLDTLGADDRPATDLLSVPPSAWLAGAPAAFTRAHASHKGSYGDVAVVGGASGMTGAALLAASAALHGGAGRVFVGLLGEPAMTVDACQPELMLRAVASMDFAALTVVCGCGGGDAVRNVLAKVMSYARALVLDADALNVIAQDSQLQALLAARARRQGNTVLTPHPLEAARLMDCSAALVQQDRLGAASQLAQRFGCTLVLKGSGSIIAAPQRTPVINPTGNASLASAGTGDVLAGMLGARLAGQMPAFEAACAAVYQHGLTADTWRRPCTLVASTLAQSQTC